MPTTPSELATTNSQPGLMLSTEDFLEPRCLLKSLRQLSLMKLVSQLQSTGQNWVQSTKLKTRVNVVHAGLSRLLLRWKVWPPSRRRNSLIFLNNNLLIVTLHLMVAKEDTHTMHSNTTRRIRQISKKTTPTKQQMEPASPLALQVRLASPRSLLSRPRVGRNLWPPLL